MSTKPPPRPPSSMARRVKQSKSTDKLNKVVPSSQSSLTKKTGVATLEFLDKVEKDRKSTGLAPPTSSSRRSEASHISSSQEVERDGDMPTQPVASSSSLKARKKAQPPASLEFWRETEKNVNSRPPAPSTSSMSRRSGAAAALAYLNSADEDAPYIPRSKGKSGTISLAAFQEAQKNAAAMPAFGSMSRRKGGTTLASWEEADVEFESPPSSPWTKPGSSKLPSLQGRELDVDISPPSSPPPRTASSARASQSFPLELDVDFDSPPPSPSRKMGTITLASLQRQEKPADTNVTPASSLSKKSGAALASSNDDILKRPSLSRKAGSSTLALLRDAEKDADTSPASTLSRKSGAAAQAAAHDTDKENSISPQSSLSRKSGSISFARWRDSEPDSRPPSSSSWSKKTGSVALATLRDANKDDTIKQAQPIITTRKAPASSLARWRETEKDVLGRPPSSSSTGRKTPSSTLAALRNTEKEAIARPSSTTALARKYGTLTIANLRKDQSGVQFNQSPFPSPTSTPGSATGTQKKYNTATLSTLRKAVDKDGSLKFPSTVSLSRRSGNATLAAMRTVSDTKDKDATLRASASSASLFRKSSGPAANPSTINTSNLNPSSIASASDAKEDKDATIKAGTIKASTIKAAGIMSIKSGSIKVVTIKAGTIKAGNIKPGTMKSGTIKADGTITFGTIKPGQGVPSVSVAPTSRSTAIKSAKSMPFLKEPQTPSVSSSAEKTTDSSKYMTPNTTSTSSTSYSNSNSNASTSYSTETSMSSMEENQTKVIEITEEQKKVAAAYNRILNPSRKAGGNGKKVVEVSAEGLKKLRRMILIEGIPTDADPTLRPRLWKSLLKVTDLSPDKYVKWVGLGPSLYKEKIRNDTFRTLATDKVFKERVTEDMLVRLLDAFIWRSEERHDLEMAISMSSKSSTAPLDFTYVQGMNVLAAPFLYTMPTEIEAFYSFSRFIEWCCPLYVQPTLDGVHKGLKLLDRCLKHIDPELFGHLRAKKLSAEIYAFPSVLTFCACTRPLDQVLQLWDFLFAFGVHLNVLCVIAQLILMREDLMASNSPMKLLRTFPKLDAQKVIGITVTLVRDLPEDLYNELTTHPYEGQPEEFFQYISE